MIERLLAAIVLAACAVLLLRLLIGARRRQRVDAALHRATGGLRRKAAALRQWRVSRRNAAHAARVADEVIARARGRGAWDGNVYTPKTFRKRRDTKPPRDKMH